MPGDVLSFLKAQPEFSPKPQPTITPEEFAHKEQLAILSSPQGARAAYRPVLDKLVANKALPADYTPDEAAEALRWVAKQQGANDEDAQIHANRAKVASVDDPQFFSGEQKQREQMIENNPVVGHTVGALQDIGHGAYDFVGRGGQFLAKMAGDDEAVRRIQEEHAKVQQQYPSQGIPYQAGMIAPMMAGGPAGAILTSGLQGGGAAIERGADRLGALKGAAAEGAVGAGAMKFGRILGGAMPAARSVLGTVGREAAIGAGEGGVFGLAPVAGALATGDTEDAQAALQGIPQSMLVGAGLRGTFGSIGTIASRRLNPADRAVVTQRAAEMEQAPSAMPAGEVTDEIRRKLLASEVAAEHRNTVAAIAAKDAQALDARQQQIGNQYEWFKNREQKVADYEAAEMQRKQAESAQRQAEELRAIEASGQVAAAQKAMEEQVAAATARENAMRLQQEAVAREQARIDAMRAQHEAQLQAEAEAKAAQEAQRQAMAAQQEQNARQQTPFPNAQEVENALWARKQAEQRAMDERVRAEAQYEADQRRMQEEHAQSQQIAPTPRPEPAPPAPRTEPAPTPQAEAYRAELDALPPEVANHPAVKSTVAEIGDTTADPAGAIGNLRQAVEIARSQNARTVRSNPEQAAPQGVQPVGRENSGSQNLQQPAQARPEAGNRQERVASGYTPGSEPGAPRMRTLAEGPKGRLETDGMDLFVNGRKVGPQSRTMEANLRKAIGAEPKPVGQVAPAKEVVAEKPAIPEGESKPIKPAEPPVVGEGQIRHPDVTLAGISPAVVGDAAQIASTIANKAYGTSADRLRSQGHTELADKMDAVPRDAKAFLGEHAPAINKALDEANIGGNAIRNLSQPDATGRAPLLDMVEGKKPAVGVAQKAVEAIWNANKLTADWMRGAGMDVSTGFKDGKGLVRMMTPEGSAATKESSPFFKALTEDIARRNGVTPESVAQHFRDDLALSDIDVAVRRNPFELARKYRDFPSHITVDGKTVQLLELDPVRYIKSLTQHAAERAAFVKNFGQKLDPGSDIAKNFPGLDEKARGELTDFAKISTGKPLSQDPIRKSISDVLGEPTARAIDRLQSAGIGSLKVLNLTASPVSNLIGGVVPTGTTPIMAFGKGLKDALLHAKRSYNEAVDIGAISRDVTRFMDPHGLPESVLTAMRHTIGQPAHWANVWADLVNANAGRSWTEAMQRQQTASKFDVARLKALGFGEEQATKLSSGKGTPEEYRQVIREVVTGTTGSNAQRAQQSVVSQHGIVRKYGPGFASYSAQQARMITRLAAMVGKGDMAAAAPLAQRVLGLTAGGAGTVLALAYLRGGTSGAQQKLEQPKESLLYESVMRGVVGGAMQGVLQNLDKTGDITVGDAARGLSYPAGKVLDFYKWYTSVAKEQDPDATKIALLSQTPGASLFKDAVAWGTGVGTPARKQAVASYYKWAAANPDVSHFKGAGSAPKPLLQIDVTKLAKALASGDKDRQKSILTEVFRQLPQAEIKAEMAGKNAPSLDKMLMNRRLLMPLIEREDAAAVSSMAKQLGPTAMRELLAYDRQLEMMAEMLR